MPAIDGENIIKMKYWKSERMRSERKKVDFHVSFHINALGKKFLSVPWGLEIVLNIMYISHLHLACL